MRHVAYMLPSKSLTSTNLLQAFTNYILLMVCARSMGIVIMHGYTATSECFVEYCGVGGIKLASVIVSV